MSGRVRRELSPWLQIEGVPDCPFEETDHVRGQLLRIVKEDIVTAVVQFEDL